MRAQTSLLDLTKWLDQHKLFHCGDQVEEVSSKVGSIFIPHTLSVVRKKQKLSANMNHLNLGNVSVNTLEYGPGISVDSTPFEKFLLLMVPMTGAMNISMGRDSFISSKNVASIINPNEPLKMEWQDNCKQLIIQINKEFIERTCETLLGHPLKTAVQFANSLDMNNGTELCENIIRLIASNPLLAQSAKSYPLLCKQIEQLLVSSLLFGQSNQYREELTSPEKIITPHYIKKAEEFMIEHASDPISTPDVANYAGISLRTLHSGFQKYRNVSPKAFLRSLRLDLAKNDLVEAKLGKKNITVTDIALKWGYPHLSHFSDSYYARHGEYPSDTLNKNSKNRGR